MKTIGKTKSTLKSWNLRSFVFSIAAIFSLSTLLSACGSESNNSGIALPPPATGVVVPGTPTGASSTTGANFYTSLTITNRQTFASLLQGSGQCDPYVVGWNYGSISCDNYSSVGYMIMQIPGAVVNGTLPAQANIWIVAGSATPYSSNSNWTTGGATRTLSAVTNLALANNSNGFTGTPMNTMPGGFRFVVNNGFPSTSSNLDVELQYNGTVFAKGTLTRY